MNFLGGIPGLEDKIDWHQVTIRQKKILFKNLELKCFGKGDYLFFKNEICKKDTACAYILLEGQVSFINEVKESLFEKHLGNILNHSASSDLFNASKTSFE
jgi:hypothetical protein